MRESDIEKKLVREIRRLGGRAYKWVSPGNDGVPDRLVFLPGGVIIPVELKTKTGKLSKLQIAQIRTLTELGSCVTVIKGEDELEDFLRVIKRDYT